MGSSFSKTLIISSAIRRGSDWGGAVSSGDGTTSVVMKASTAVTVAAATSSSTTATNNEGPGRRLGTTTPRLGEGSLSATPRQTSQLRQLPRGRQHGVQPEISPAISSSPVNDGSPGRAA